MRVEEFLESSARRLPDKVALVCEDRRWTYAELDRQAEGLANALRRLGVKRGDRVAVHLDNSAAAVVAIFGTLKIGGVFVLVSPSTKAAKLAHILRDCQATALVADALRGVGIAVRRSATAYGDRSMLDLFAADEHERLRRSVRESFDFSRVA